MKFIQVSESLSLLLENYGGGIWYHGTDNLFDNPRFQNLSNAVAPMGFHLGNLNQAKNIKKRLHSRLPKYINVYKVNNIKPIRVKDMVYWTPRDIANQLINLGYKVESEKPKSASLQKSGERIYRNNHILDTLKRYGYNSLIYANEWEGEGDTLVVFDDSVLKLIDRIDNTQKINNKDEKYNTQ